MCCSVLCSCKHGLGSRHSIWHGAPGSALCSLGAGSCSFCQSKKCWCIKLGSSPFCHLWFKGSKMIYWWIVAQLFAWSSRLSPLLPQCLAPLKIFCIVVCSLLMAWLMRMMDFFVIFCVHFKLWALSSTPTNCPQSLCSLLVIRGTRLGSQPSKVN